MKVNRIKRTNMNKYYTSIFAGVLMVLMSFSNTEDPNVCGTYNGGDTSIVELLLTPNHKFKYNDLSNMSNKIEVSGEWEIKKGWVYLKSVDDQEIKFHDKWKWDSKCNCIKSGKGMTFYRLCK